MKIAIMQPYFFPYIGFFQLAKSVDKFIVYDDIQYTKKGWIQRNRILVNGKPSMFSLSIKKDSDYLDIIERELSDSYDRVKLCRQILGAYKKAPFFNEVYPLLEDIINFKDNNLFSYVNNSISCLFNNLDIKTDLIVSSSLAIPRDNKSQERVVKTCIKMNASHYINPPGGVDLYSKDAFLKAGIELKFIDPVIQEYKQSGSEFISHLSIIDILMWNGISKTKQMVNEYGYL